MDTQRDAAAQMGNDQIEIFITLALLIGIFDRHGSAVQYMAETAAGDFGYTGDAGDLRQFAGGHGIIDESRDIVFIRDGFG